MRLSLAILALLLTAACAGGRATLPTTYSLDPQDKEGIVIVGSVSRDYIAVNFMGFDEKTKTLYTNRLAPGTGFVHSPSKGALQYHVMAFPAGTWVLQSTRQTMGNTRLVGCLSKGTIKFDVKPGQIIYIGNISLGWRRAGAAGSDLDAARRALNTYPNLTGEIIEVEPERTTFKSGTTLFGGKGKTCAGYYLKGRESA